MGTAVNLEVPVIKDAFLIRPSLFAADKHADGVRLPIDR